jgi:hypothetical protein
VEAGIIEPALLRPDERFAGMPQLPADYGTASVPNPDSELYRALYPSATASNINPSETHTVNYAATIMSRSKAPQESRFNSRAVAEAILALVGVRPVDPAIIQNATDVLKRYAPNVPVTPDFMSFSNITDADIPSFMNDGQIDNLIKNLLNKPEDEFITAIDGITIIPSNSPFKVKLDDVDVDIPNLSIIVDENGDHFLFVLNDVGNSKVDWAKLPIIENLDNGTFTVDQAIYNLKEPSTPIGTTPETKTPNWFERNVISPTDRLLPGVRNWWQRNVGDLNFRGLGNDQVPTPNTTSTNNWFDNIIARFDGVAQPNLMNQEVPNVTRLTPDDQISSEDLLNNANQVGQTNPKFTETKLTIDASVPPTNIKTLTSYLIDVNNSIPTKIFTVDPTYYAIGGGVLLYGADYLLENNFGIDIASKEEIAGVTSFSTHNSGSLMSLNTNLNNSIQPVFNSIIKESVIFLENEPATNSINTNFVFYSQRDPEWQDLPVYGSTSIEESCCGIIAGAMATKTDPEEYYLGFLEYYKSQGYDKSLTESGTSWSDHKEYLEHLGYTVIPVVGSREEITDQIGEYTNSGTPVWVNAEFYGARYGHHNIAVGTNSQEESIIFNDPWRGENTQINLDDIDTVNEDADGFFWKVFAIVPPTADATEQFEIIDNQSGNINNID